MFTSIQILPTTKLVKNFKNISNALEQSLQALLITQKKQTSSSVYIYEDLLENSIRKENFDHNFEQLKIHKKIPKCIKGCWNCLRTV